MHPLIIFTSLLLLIAYPVAAYADNSQKPVAYSADAGQIELAQDTSAEQQEQAAAEEDAEDEEDEKDAAWKSDGVDFIINTFKLESSISSSSDPGRKYRENTRFVSVSSIGIQSHHDRMTVGFSVGTPFVSGALQVPSSGAFHLGYQIDRSWQIGLLAFIDFNRKMYSEDDEDANEPDGVSALSTGATYNSSSLATALGGWLEYSLFDWGDLQFSLYQVRSVVRSSITREYDGLPDDIEEAESGVEYMRFNFSLSRNFKIGSNLEVAPKVLLGFNTFYDRDYRYESVNDDAREVDFDNSEGLYLSVTLGSFIYHL